MRKNIKDKIYLTLAAVLLFGIAFYLISYDFGKISRFICGSDKDASVQYGIPVYWLERYEIKLVDESDTDQDIDNDGLSLLKEYKYFTNPLEADTDKDGYNDGKEVRDGYNPIGEGRLDIDGDNLPDFWEKENGLSLENNDYELDPDNDNLSNYLEYAHLTNPLESDTDGDGYNDFQEIQNGYDPAKGGDAKPSYEIIVNKIDITAPIIWSTSLLEEDLLEDLKSGTIRYPKTGILGQSGNAVVTGHSSNYAWVEGDYNYVFRDLNNLDKGDEVIIQATQHNGKSFKYKYIITEKEVVKPDNVKIFQETRDSSLTLVTCWPLGTKWNRLMVKAELAK